MATTRTVPLGLGRRLPAVTAAMAVTVVLALAPIAAGPVGAQVEPPPAATSMEAVVTAIVDEGQREIAGEVLAYQTLELRITSGARRGETAQVETGDIVSAGGPRYAVGDQVLLSAESYAAGEEVLYIGDRVRRRPLGLLLLVFVALVLAVARWRGLASLVAMALTFALIFAYLLPRISAGDDPILAAIVSALFIVPVTFYLSHGVNRKTTAAVVGTLVALLVTSLAAVVAVDGAVITGYASEEASQLQNLLPGVVNVRGLLLASIIIGLCGVLDDITVSQAAIVAQLRAVAGHLGPREVYGRAMDIGRDHIASLVNTLILVYASSAMPLLHLFLYSDAPLTEVVNYEIVAEEIVRTLVASIGLVLAVPLTTAIAVLMLRASDATLDAPDRTHQA